MFNLKKKTKRKTKNTTLLEQMHRKISCKVDTPNTHIRLLPGLVQALQYKGAGVKLILRPHKIFGL